MADMYSNVVITLLLSTIVFSSFASWQVESVGGSYQGLVPAIALDTNGYPHVTHSDPYSLFHSWKNQTGWQTELIWGSSYAGTEGSDIVIDSSDLCHVSFARSGILYYSFQTSSPDVWNTEVVTPMVYGTWTSLGLDSSGYPNISTYANDELLFVEWSGSSWTSETVSSVGDEGDCNSLVIDQSGKPHIAFCAYSPTGAVRYSYRDEYGVWQTMTVDDTMGNYPQGTSLAMDDQGYPHISYNTSSEIRYASWNGSSWDIETVDAIDTGLQEFDTSLALDQFGFPHIAHCLSTGDSLMYSVNQGAGWITEAVYPLEFDMGGDPDLVLDEFGRPHIAFYSGLYGPGLMYAYNDEPSGIGSDMQGIETLSLQTGPNPFSGILNITCDCPSAGNSTIRVLDVSGRLVNEIDMDTGTTSWMPDASIPDGAYFIVLGTEEGAIVNRCLLLR